MLKPPPVRRFTRAFIATAAVATATRARAQSASIDSARVRALADSAIVHRDWKQLVSLYQPVTKASPGDGLAWFRLGVGYQEAGSAPDAIVALRRAVALNFQVGPAELRLARLFARGRMNDSVAEHLERAASAGTPVELMTTEPDLAAARKDPRVVKLVATLEKNRYPCRSQPEAHQFDFWVGDWAVTGWNVPAVTVGRGAENRVSPDLEHCVIHEHWTSATGGKGESWNFWDPNRHAWRQIWMDDGQWSLDYEGEYEDGAMRFHGWTLGPTGERRLEKLTFFNISPDTVRQLFEQSSDSGKTWHTTFDGRYVRMNNPHDATVTAPASIRPASAVADCRTDSGVKALDFILGDWTVRDSGGAIVGTNRLDSAAGGCAIDEIWHDPDGTETRALFFYVQHDRRWELVLVGPDALEPGGLRRRQFVSKDSSGAMRFLGEIPMRDGLTALNRLTLEPMRGGRVREVVDVSRDGGSTWVKTFDAVYEPRR